LTGVRTRFGRFTVDSDTRQLLRDHTEVHLSPKAFDLLWALIQDRPRVIEKTALHARIWPETFVVDANLNVLIGEIRRAIDDTPQKPAFIRTVHGVGYAFCGTAANVREDHVPAATLFSWVVWKDRTFPLSEGDNLIGRDPGCSIWLDAAGVSRRHARLRLDSARRHVTLEDLGSTNGTFRRRSRVEKEIVLADGDQIRLGPVPITVRLWVSDQAPETRRIRRKAK
jgi:DNA-binding winged helix-turn-helix (wHTH) protein